MGIGLGGKFSGPPASGVPSIEQVLNYAALPAASSVPNQFRYVLNETGSYLTFNKRKRGWYESDGSNWLYAGDNTRLASDSSFTPNGDISAGNVQDAIVEVRDDTNTKIAAIDHNTLINYNASRHIDHSIVSISPGYGLTGGGTLLSTRTLAASIHYIEKTATGNFTTTSATYTAVASLSATPASGVYYCSFSATGSGNTDGNDLEYALQYGATLIGHSDRDAEFITGGVTSLANLRFGFHTQAIITVNGSQIVSAMARTNTGTFTIRQRSLSLIRIS